MKTNTNKLHTLKQISVKNFLQLIDNDIVCSCVVGSSHIDIDNDLLQRKMHHTQHTILMTALMIIHTYV